METKSKYKSHKRGHSTKLKYMQIYEWGQIFRHSQLYIDDILNILFLTLVRLHVSGINAIIRPV
jgi:hypothetical protein